KTCGVEWEEGIDVGGECAAVGRGAAGVVCAAVGGGVTGVVCAAGGGGATGLVCEAGGGGERYVAGGKGPVRSGTTVG
ncbi:hypothetical protein U1Q18_012036, partial [Sarracenia purpurea var. burkii]